MCIRDSLAGHPPGVLRGGGHEGRRRPRQTGGRRCQGALRSLTGCRAEPACLRVYPPPGAASAWHGGPRAGEFFLQGDDAAPGGRDCV
eukprot:5253731-Alexandrium_andersonii.AAC.1